MGRTVLRQAGIGRSHRGLLGAVRLLVLCLFVLLVEMASPRFGRDAAAEVMLVGFGLLVAALLLFGVFERVLQARIARRVAGLSRAERHVGATLGLLRLTGLPLVGLGFFLIWTFVYIGVWWYRPGGAFGGLAVEPRFADFFFYAVSTGLISPPNDIVAASRGARAATLIEMITALALVTTYLSSFTDFLARREPDQPEQTAA